MIIAYCIHYLLFSFRSELLWSKCPETAVDCFKRSNLSASCDNITRLDASTYRSPSEVYF